jgi:hypothetical protein
MTDEQLSALLRLKRYEQPPVQYFDRLLQDVHRRQRADLLQLPLWKIAIERMQTFFGEHSMGHLSYAGALASVLVVGVTTIGLMTPGHSIERVELAQNSAPTFSGNLVSIQPSNKVPGLDRSSLQTAQPRLESAASQPRYVIDARPASYEPSPSINF